MARGPEHEAGKSSLAFNRTRLASERTLMAWVRTAVSLIGFGFTIPKFLGLLAENGALKGAPNMSPQTLGILLIGLGTVGLAGGIIEHLRLVRRLAPQHRRRDELSATMVTAILVGLVGVLAFINVALA